MSQDVILMVSLFAGGLVCVFGLYFLVFKGKSKNQKLAEKWKAQGCITTGRKEKVKVIRANGEDKRKAIGRDSYVVTYAYFVQGVTYKKVLSFEDNYPVNVTIYYNPNNPKRSIAANEATRAEQVQHGCLITVVATIATIGILINLLMRLF